MTKLNITKEQFNKSQYFQKKYGKLKYVSESGKLFKTSKGKVLKFNEAFYTPKQAMEYYQGLCENLLVSEGCDVEQVGLGWNTLSVRTEDGCRFKVTFEENM